MITYITGVPGAGKTLNTIKLVIDEVGDSDRPIYYVGINELTLPWNKLTYEDIANWKDYPPGSVFVIDEAYNCFPRRTHSKEAPQYIKDLSTHRHGGYDFYVITQKHTSVDHGVREHVNRHIHFERAFGLDSCRRLEWTKAVDPDDYHVRQEALTRRVRFDKSIYKMYKSAEVHTFKKRIPKKLWLMAAFAAGCIFLAFSIATRDRNFQDDSLQEYSDDTFFPQPFNSRNSNDETLTPQEYADSWSPRIPGIPHSAPAYDEVTVVKTFPRPQCILHIKSGTCSCYSQQATPINVGEATCLRIVSYGWFNPYKDEEEIYKNEKRASGRATAPRASRSNVRNNRDNEATIPTIVIGSDLVKQNPYL